MISITTLQLHCSCFAFFIFETGQGDGQSQRSYQEEQDARQYDQAVRDTYAPEFSASANKPQPIARRQDNVRGEEWFANTTYDGRTTMHKFGW